MNPTVRIVLLVLVCCTSSLIIALRLHSLFLLKESTSKQQQQQQQQPSQRMAPRRVPYADNVCGSANESATKAKNETATAAAAAAEPDWIQNPAVEAEFAEAERVNEMLEQMHADVQARLAESNEQLQELTAWHELVYTSSIIINGFILAVYGTRLVLSLLGNNP